MKAIVVSSPGGPENLKLENLPDLKPGPGELLIRTRAAGLNGADLLQRRGLYPPPPGASPLLGLEAAGEIMAVGPASGPGPAAGSDPAPAWKPGQKVMALLPGGGYAEQVVIPAELAMPIPPNLSWAEAGGLPETFLTAYLELFKLGGLKKGENLLIHAGASGVGTSAIQLAREEGARIFVTASSATKLERCRELGAQVLINYKEEDFAARVQKETNGKGVDCILDLVGAAHWAGNVDALALDGRLLLVGLGGGAKAEVDLRKLIGKRIRVIGSNVRSRTVVEKAALTREFWEFAGARFADGRLKVVLDKRFKLEEAAEAHRYLESQANIGKVVLEL